MLSIIMPVLNEADVIGATLARLAAARPENSEVILVDGGSSDGTADLAVRLADRVVHAPRGRAAQMNAGAAAAKGSVLLFLHADTLVPPTFCSAMQTALATGAQWGRFDVAIDGRHPMLQIIGAAMNLRSRLTGIATGDQAIFVTRRLFDAVGGYPALPLMEDVALSRALRARAAPACLRARVVTSGRRWEQRGVWRTLLLMWWLRFAYWCGADAAAIARRYS